MKCIKRITALMLAGAISLTPVVEAAPALLGLKAAEESAAAISQAAAVFDTGAVADESGLNEDGFDAVDSISADIDPLAELLAVNPEDEGVAQLLERAHTESTLEPTSVGDAVDTDEARSASLFAAKPAKSAALSQRSADSGLAKNGTGGNETDNNDGAIDDEAVNAPLPAGADGDDRQHGEAVAFVPSGSKDKAMAYVSGFVLSAVRDGAGDWDDHTDNNGYDSSESNRIVRTQDDITYYMSYSTALNDAYRYKTISGAKLYLQFTLPVSETKAEYYLEAMPWLKGDGAGGKPVLKTSNNGNTQTLIGYRDLPDREDTYGLYDVPGAGTVNCVIHVKDMKAGEQIQPVFKAWIEATSNTAAPNYAVEASAGRNCPDSKVTVTVGAHISLRINADTTTIADYGTFTGLNPNGNQVTFDGRLKPFTFRIVAGKQNGMAKGTAPLTAGSRVRVNFNLKSDVVDDPNGTESALWAIKTRGRDSTDALGHAVSEFPGLEKYYTTTDPGLGSVSSVSSSGGTYSFDITGFTGRNPGDTVSEGILVCSQRMPLSGPSTYHYNTTVTCSTALITANDGHGERTLSLEYPTGSGIYPAASHSNAVTEPGSYNTTIHLYDVVEDENGKRPLLSAGETSTANAIGYGKEFYVTAAHTNILYSAENKIKSYNQYILWDNNKVDLVVNNNGVYDTTIFSMSGWTKYYYEEDYPIRFITKKDGTTWTSDEEMTTANLKNFDDLRFYKNYSSVPYGWKLCGILVEGRHLRDEVLGTDNIHGIIFRMKTVDNQANVNQVAMFTQSVDAYREEKGNITRASSNGMGIVMVDGDRVSRYMGNRTYTKTRWNEDGTIDSSSLTAHNIVYEGTSLLIKGFTCLVDIKHMDGTESKTLDLGTARNIEFRVQPKLYSKDLNTVAKSTELVVTVPEGLEVAAVSAGNRHDSVMFGRNHETSRYAEGNSGTFKVTKESGKVRVVFTNAVSDKELPEFFIKYNFVPGYLKNGSTVTIDAQYTGDSRAVNKVAGNEATASFRIVETEASVLKETVDKKEVKNGEKLTYTMTYLNRSGENTPLSLTSVKPVNGDAAGTQLSGGGTLKFVSVTAEASRGSAINASSTANGIKATGTVLPGEEVIVTAVYEVKDAVEGDMIRNFCQQEDENGTIVSNSVETTVLQQRGDISFVKAVKDSLWPLPGVSFRITSVKTGESAVVNTGSDGSYSSATITSDRIWFGSQRSDNSSGALPYGKYRIQELSTGIASRSTELIDMTIELNDSTVNKNTGLYDLGTLTNAFVLEIKKAVDRVSNDLGEKHTWTVEASVPAGISADRGSCSYELVDPLDSRLKYEGNVKVSTVNGTVVSTMVSGTDYTLAEPQTSSGGTLSVRMTTAGIKKLESVEAVRLTFMTSINSSAQAGVNIPNQATLNYSGFGYRQTLHSNEPYVYTGRIAVSKKDAETGRPMQDVTFQLLRIGEGGSETTFERDGSPLTAVTNSSGEAVFFGLKDGNYKVVEVSTRAGYTLLPEGIQAEIEQGQSEVINMTNQEGVHLSAGGEGIASMYQRGLFLIAVSLLASKKNLFVRRKQKISAR